MAYDFPATPTLNQIVTFGSTAWQWNGTAWLMQSGNVGPAGPAGADGAAGATGPQGPVGPAGPVGEAPNDGQQYARKNLAWSQFTIPAPAPAVGLVDIGDTPPVAPLDKQQFWKSDDGTMWLRYNDGTGPAQWVQTNAQPTPASVITEQFFDVSGLTQKDITVPTWAKGVEITASIIPPVASQSLAVRVSSDGTTFAAGASDYSSANPYHIALPTPTYGATAAAAAPWLVLGIPGTSVAIPHQIDAFITLERKLTSEGFAARSYARTLDNTSGSSTGWVLSWVSGATLGSALRIAALRFMMGSSGVMGNGSFIRVKWIGDSNAIQTGTAIADAPSDGGEYTRVNGVWRLKSQSFVLDGLAIQDFQIPAAARLAKLSLSAAVSATASISMRWSGDGTTFLSGATDYTYGGFFHYTGSGGFANCAVTNAAYVPLAYTSDSTAIFAQMTGIFQVRKTVNSVFTSRYNSQAYYGASATAYMSEYFLNCYSNGNFGTNQMKAMRIYTTAGTVREGVLDVEWVY